MTRPRIPLGATLGLIAIPLLLTGAAFSLRELGQARDRERLDRGAALAALLAQSAGRADPDRTPDTSLLLRLTDYAGRNLGLDYAMVVDQEGHILQHTDLGQLHAVAAPGSWGIAARDGISQSGHLVDTENGARPATIEFAAPIFGESGPVGAAVVGLRSHAGGVGLADARPLLIPAAFMLLMIPLTFVVVRLAVRPLLATGEELRSILAAQRVPGLPTLHGAEPGAFAAGMKELVREFMRVFREQEDRKQALEIECRVHEFERRRLEALLERIPEGLVLEGPDGRVELMNSAAENMLGVNRDALLNGGTQADALLAAPSGSRAPGETGRGDDLDLSAVPIHDADRTLLGTLHLVRDLSGSRLMEQAQHEFVSHLAHEVKSPLNTIRSYTEMLLEGDVADLETRKEFFNTINEEAARLARLIENLLHLSRIEMGHLRLEKQFVKTQNLIEHAITAVAPLARGKGQNLRVALPDRMGSLSGDRQLLEVAIINILGNAVKYTPSGGHVSLTVEERPGEVQVTVKDDGPGIRPEDQGRIFDKFFRSDAPEVAGQPGHGLGLSLTREILELHGGSIRLESEPGKGSAFIVTIPIDATGGAAVPGLTLTHQAPVPAAMET